MNYEKLVQGILNIGEAMLQCGAEIFRVEDSLYRMYKSYGLHVCFHLYFPIFLYLQYPGDGGDTGR